MKVDATLPCFCAEMLPGFHHCMWCSRVQATASTQHWAAPISNRTGPSAEVDWPATERMQFGEAARLHIAIEMQSDHSSTCICRVRLCYVKYPPEVLSSLVSSINELLWDT